MKGCCSSPVVESLSTQVCKCQCQCSCGNTPHSIHRFGDQCANLRWVYKRGISSSAWSRGRDKSRVRFWCEANNLGSIWVAEQGRKQVPELRWAPRRDCLQAISCGGAAARGRTLWQLAAHGGSGARRWAVVCGSRRLWMNNYWHVFIHLPFFIQPGWACLLRRDFFLKKRNYILCP